MHNKHLKKSFKKQQQAFKKPLPYAAISVSVELSIKLNRPSAQVF